MLDARLDELGFTEAHERAFAPHAEAGLLPGRVVAGHTRYLRVATANGEVLAELAGSLRHQARSAEQLPAVGDFVALRAGGDGSAVIQAVLPRGSAFVRRAAGVRAVAQVLAANVDTVFLVMGLDGDFNVRRAERALVLAWDSGASPVLLLNKADLCPDVEARRAEVERSAPGVPVRVVAAKPGSGLEALEPWLGRGRTVVLLGSSGVGKSTLVNRLLGREKQKTREVIENADQRGRHTTTHRELVALPGGALLIDTPGLRELQLWSDGAGLEAAFDDVSRVAASCRFSDCGHGSEPGCAVRAAVEDGRLDPARLDSYKKLAAELRALEVREDPLRRRAELGRHRAVFKAMRKNPKRA